MSIFNDPWGRMIGRQLANLHGQAVGMQALRRAAEAQRLAAEEAVKEQRRQFDLRNNQQDYIDGEFEVVEEAEQILIEGKEDVKK